MVAFQKADGVGKEKAEVAARELIAVADLLLPPVAGWTVPVTTVSAVTGDGVAQLWQRVLDHRAFMLESGHFEVRRREQSDAALQAAIVEGVLAEMSEESAVRDLHRHLRRKVAEGRVRCHDAARTIIAAYRSRADGSRS